MARLVQKAGMKAIPSQLRPLRSEVTSRIAEIHDLTKRDKFDLATTSNLTNAWIKLLEADLLITPNNPAQLDEEHIRAAARILHAGYKAKKIFKDYPKIPFGKQQKLRQSLINQIRTTKQDLIATAPLLPPLLADDLAAQLDTARWLIESQILNESRSYDRNIPAQIARSDSEHIYVIENMAIQLRVHFKKPCHELIAAFSAHITGSKPLSKQSVIAHTKGLKPYQVKGKTSALRSMKA